MGPLALSSNAEPNYNLRFVSTRPHPLPFFPSFGTYRFDIVIGQAVGTLVSSAPLVQRAKSKLQLWRLPRDRLHSLVLVFWKVKKHPITLHSFKRQYLQLQLNWRRERPHPHMATRTDPGDRKSKFPISATNCHFCAKS